MGFIIPSAEGGVFMRMERMLLSFSLVAHLTYMCSWKGGWDQYLIQWSGPISLSVQTGHVWCVMWPSMPPLLMQCSGRVMVVDESAFSRPSVIVERMVAQLSTLWAVCGLFLMNSESISCPSVGRGISGVHCQPSYRCGRVRATLWFE